MFSLPYNKNVKNETFEFNLMYTLPIENIFI